MTQPRWCHINALHINFNNSVDLMLYIFVIYVRMSVDKSGSLAVSHFEVYCQGKGKNMASSNLNSNSNSIHKNEVIRMESTMMNVYNCHMFKCLVEKMFELQQRECNTISWKLLVCKILHKNVTLYTSKFILYMDVVINVFTIEICGCPYRVCVCSLWCN